MTLSAWDDIAKTDNLALTCSAIALVCGRLARSLARLQRSTMRMKIVFVIGAPFRAVHDAAMEVIFALCARHYFNCQKYRRVGVNSSAPRTAASIS